MRLALRGTMLAGVCLLSASNTRRRLPQGRHIGCLFPSLSVPTTTLAIILPALCSFPQPLGLHFNCVSLLRLFISTISHFVSIYHTFNTIPSFPNSFRSLVLATHLEISHCFMTPTININVYTFLSIQSINAVSCSITAVRENFTPSQN